MHWPNFVTIISIYETNECQICSSMTKSGTYEELQVLSDSSSETRVSHCCCRLYLRYECAAWRFNHAKYFCWKREIFFMFCLSLKFEKKKKKFLQNICCMFLCPSMAYKWVCSDGLIMLPLEVNIKSWFASFVGLSKTNIWVISIFKSFHTEMSCMLSALLFIPPCPKNKVSLTFGEFYQL